MQFWEPSTSKRKKTKAEREQEEAEQEAVFKEDFRPEEDSQELAEGDRVTVDAYMSVLSRRSPEIAELDSLLHAAETSLSTRFF